MLKKLVRYLRGYLLLQLSGIYPERFLNLCNNRDILVWGVSVENNQYQCYMTLRDYWHIRDIARKTKVVPYVSEKFGFPFFMQRMKKHKSYWIAFALFCILVYTLSLFIWDIGIEGTYRHTPEQLLDFLKKQEVYSGMRIKDVDCPQIEEDIRREFTDIGWVSAEIMGTKLIIRINETTVPILNTELRKTDMEQANIVASKDAIIASIVTREGTPLVGLGSIVKKGDVLISGIVSVLGDDQTVVDTKLLVADGDIMCKTYYNYSSTFPMKYIQKIYTGKEKKGYQLLVLDNKIISYNPRNSYGNCDIISDVKTLKLIRNFYLPIKLKEIRQCQYYEEERVYTEAEAYEIANRNLLRYMEDLRKSGATIIENHVEIKVEGENCTAKGKIIVEEAAWEYHKIE